MLLVKVSEKMKMNITKKKFKQEGALLKKW